MSKKSSGEASPPIVPPKLHTLSVPTGVHNRWTSAAWFGGWKKGKSFALASYPPPLLAIDCGDGGIGLYLPQNDPRYMCFQCTSPTHMSELIDFAIKNQDWFNSVVIDDFTNHWTDHASWWEEELEVEELKAHHWKRVKGPWKINLTRMRRASFHVGYSVRIKDIEYTTEDTGKPGQEGKLVIKEQAVPAFEKNVGYALDLIFECDVKLDAKNRPTATHIVRYHGGRRPVSVPPEKLYIGQTWQFNSKKPTSVWDSVMAPLLPEWESGADEGFDKLPAEIEEGRKKLVEASNDAITSELVRKIEEYEDLNRYKTFFQTEVQEALATLPEAWKKQIRKAHEAKKKELQG